MEYYKKKIPQKTKVQQPSNINKDMSSFCNIRNDSVFLPLPLKKMFATVLKRDLDPIMPVKSLNSFLLS